MAYYPQTQGPIVYIGLPEDVSPQLSDGPAVTIDSTAIITLRITAATQRGGPLPIADVVGSVYGSGVYDGHAIALNKVEVGLTDAGPWTELVVLSGDPAYVFPATATAAGAAFNIPVEPDVWGASYSLYYKLTVTPLALSDIDDIAGPYVYNGDITPSAPASITVPTSSTGTFTVSWSSVSYATGYQLQEGIEVDGSVVWGAVAYSGSNTSVSLTRTPGYTYWYRVRSYNSIPNYSTYTTSVNGCNTIIPAILMSPDLGWASLSRMLNPAYNPMVVSVNVSDTTDTSDVDIGYIGPMYRVVTTPLGRKILPANVVRGLVGNEILYKYKLSTSSTIYSTILKTAAGAVPDE